MTKKGAIRTTILFIAIALVVLVGIVKGQSTVKSQQWEYALLIYDTSDNSFLFRSSTIYEAVDFAFAVPVKTTQDMVDAIGTISDSGLSDYLAIMGVSGYELVDTIQIPGAGLVYHFKRPAKQ